MSWTLQPATGTTNLKSLTKITNSEWYIACRTGGILQTLDSGQSWHALNAGLSGVDCISVTDTPHGIIAGATTGAFRLSGSAWVKLTGLTSTPGYVVVHGNEIIVLSNQASGAWRAYASTDGIGFTAKSTGSIFSGLGGMLWGPDSQGRLWTTTEGAGIFYSSDAGVTWLHAPPTSVTGGPGFIEAPDGTIIYFSKNDVWRWVNANWVVVPRSVGPYYLDTVFASLTIGNAIYVGTGHVHSAVYRSVDNGQSWQSFNEVPPPAASSSDPLVRVYDMFIRNDGHLLFGTRGGLLYASNTPLVEWTSAPPFQVSVEGSVTFGGGIISTYSNFAHNGTSAQLASYIAQHYRRF